MKKGMIKVSVLYPGGEGKTFNMDYYTNQHAQLVSSLLGQAIKGFAVDKGLSGVGPGSPPTYVICGHLYFDSTEAFTNAFGPHAQKIMGDVSNFTNIEPVVQISEVIV